MDLIYIMKLFLDKLYRIAQLRRYKSKGWMDFRLLIIKKKQQQQQVHDIKLTSNW